ncbi:MAG: hypothetical protein RLZZ283_496 [Candidatus Parcubacteria bacterium]|jgi:plastocyanin
MDQKNMILGGALLIIVILGAYVLWPEAGAPVVEDIASSTPVTALEPTVAIPTVTQKPTVTPVVPVVVSPTGGQRSLENNVWVTEIVYTDSGFSPVNIKIQAGEEVRFVNQSSGAMRVVANTKDSSDYYKLINQGTAVAKGKSYQVSLFKPGLFIYSNSTVQWNPSGSITVY